MAAPDYLSGGALTDTSAWVAIDSAELGSDQASITFTSSTGTKNWSQYLDLVVLADVRSAYNGEGDSLKVVINDDDSSSHYPAQWFRGNGSSASAGVYDYPSYGLLGNIPGDTITTNIFAAVKVQFFDINSGKFKGYIAEAAGDTADANRYVYTVGSTYYGDFVSGDWNNNVPGTKGQLPISELKFFAGGNLKAGSRIDLFGVLPRMVS